LESFSKAVFPLVMTDETENTVILATGECASQTRRATFVHYELKPQHVKLHQSHHGSLSGNQQTITHWIWQKSSSWGFQEQVRPENDFPSSTHRDFDPQADSLRDISTDSQLQRFLRGQMLGFYGCADTLSMFYGTTDQV